MHNDIFVEPTTLTTLRIDERPYIAADEYDWLRVEIVRLISRTPSNRKRAKARYQACLSLVEEAALKTESKKTGEHNYRLLKQLITEKQHNL